MEIILKIHSMLDNKTGSIHTNVVINLLLFSLTKVYARRS